MSDKQIAKQFIANRSNRLYNPVMDREQYAVSELGQILAKHANTLSTIDSTLKALRTAGLRIEDVVGDPHSRPSVRAYRTHIDVLRIRFHHARKDAKAKINSSGEWSLKRRYLGECLRGYRALAYLDAAGYLYQARVTGLIDVRLHQRTIEDLFSFPSQEMNATA